MRQIRPLQIRPLRQYTTRTQVRAIAADFGDQQALARGLVNGVLLSVIMWIAAGYLTFILR